MRITDANFLCLYEFVELCRTVSHICQCQARTNKFLKNLWMIYSTTFAPNYTPAETDNLLRGFSPKLTKSCNAGAMTFPHYYLFNSLFLPPLGSSTIITPVFIYRWDFAVYNMDKGSSLEGHYLVHLHLLLVYPFRCPFDKHICQSCKFILRKLINAI